MYSMNSGRMPATIMLVTTLAISGCAGMSSEECAVTDWSAIGYEDGARGYTMDRFATHRKACAKHGYAPDFQAYKAGRDEGLVDFCQPSRGYALGESGGRYYGVCDVAMEEEFLDAYRVGHQLYSLRANVNSVNSQIYARERELERIGNTIRDKQALLIAEDTTVQERVLLLADLEELSERTGELETEIEVLIQERSAHEHELADYENTVSAYGF